MSATELLPTPRPRVVTSGFTAVDVTVNGVTKAAPGGTAVNVATILSRLGWDAEVVGTVGADPAGELLLETLAADRVRARLLRRLVNWTTPIVVQERHRNDHTWRFSCPVCGARFAKHRPSEAAFAEIVKELVPAPKVFFFDRVSLFTLDLARSWKLAGTTIFFEPASLGRPALFERAVELADVVKYSSERGAAFEERLNGTNASLIKTLGEGGAQLHREGVWTHVPGLIVTNLVDSAGAGDWTTAGIIDTLLGGNVPGDWVRAVSDGQRLGAQACGWQGVRPESPRELGGDFEAFGCPRIVTPKLT